MSAPQLIGEEETPEATPLAGEDAIGPAPPALLIKPTGRVSLRLQELWAYRELFYFLVWRDIKVRYKQTGVGAAWAILQPVLTMIVFSIFFGHLAKLPSDGLPYPVFSYSGLLPWQLFVFALTSSASSLVANQQLVTKVYFPRLIVPIGATLAGLVDFMLAFLVLLGLMGWYGITPTIAVVTLPAFVLLALATALGVGMWLCALNVQYRDVQYVIPFLVQFWLFATPIAYASSLVPSKWQVVYGLNPMAGVVNGFRWALLGQAPLDWPLVAVSTGVVVAMLVGGLYYFRRMERTFADLV